MEANTTWLRKLSELMPSHLHYVEPFFGGGAVLLARDPEDDGLWLFPHKGVSEVVNDINGKLDQLLARSPGPRNFRVISPPARGHADGATGMGGRASVTFTAMIRSPTRSLSSLIAGKADPE